MNHASLNYNIILPQKIKMVSYLRVNIKAKLLFFFEFY